jgi:hypothetical protein
MRAVAEELLDRIVRELRAGEIADATGIARNTVASTVTRLVASGALERGELPEGGVGFCLPRYAPASRPSTGSGSRS